MKTAVIIDGQQRTFARCLPNQKRMLYRHLGDVDFFVSCADDENAASAELLRKEFPNSKVVIEKVTPPQLPEPPAVLADHAPYALTPTKTPGVSAFQGILRQLWHHSRAWKFANENGVRDYGFVVRCRADLHFHEFKMPIEFPFTKEAYTPWWGTYGGVNDRFALLGYDAAKAYFETYDVLPDLLAEGCSFHPESLIHAALERAEIDMRFVLANFSFRRLNGDMEHMAVQPHEIAYLAATLSRNF